MRLFLISDIHVDFAENAKWIEQISKTEYQQDALILAGDVAHNLDLLQDTLLLIKSKFRLLFYVPGNHDLWLHNSDWENSVEKFQSLIQWCNQVEIQTKPLKIGIEQTYPAWIIPLFSWYSDKVEGKHSLYMEKPGEDQDNRMWSDNYYVRWPNAENGFQPDAYFAAINQSNFQETYDAHRITFSHFLSRQEMIFGDSLKPDPEKAKKYDRNPKFNFSRVAGSTKIEQQIRQLGSKIHLYGHQHINRDRKLDGVRYVAHCLGYPNERLKGMVRGIDQGLKLVWDTELGG